MRDTIKKGIAAIPRDPVLFLATAGGSGLLPKAPGTWGTLFGIPLCLLFLLLPVTVQPVVLVAGILFGVRICDLAEQRLGCKDPQSVVLDEVLGLAVTFIGLPVCWEVVVAGFVLFRFFDVVKPWPVRLFDREFPGGAGIVLDDLAAGLWARGILGILMVVFA